MRNLFIILLLVVCSGCRPGQTVLKGHIGNYHGEVVRICAEGQSDRRDTLVVDTLGNFIFSPANGVWSIYEISVKDHSPWVPVYIGAGDQVEMKLVLQQDKRIDVTFSGDRPAENAYLWAYCEAKNRRFWNDPEVKGISFRSYEDKIEAMRKALQEKLDKVKDEVTREKLAVKQHLMLQEHLLNYNCLQDEDRTPNADYAFFVKSIDLNDPRQANERIVESVIGWYLTLEPDKEENYQIAYLETLERKVTDRTIVDKQATRSVTGLFRHYSGNLDDVMAVYNRICSNDSLREAVNDEYKEYVRAFGNLMPGKPAPDFEMTDMTGKKCRLSDLRGKYLYIDVWATWCSPCREEIPYMARLYEHFAKDKRIALVSISVDSNVKTWEQFIEREKPAWAQYVVDRKTNAFLDKEYRIYGIPHFMLIDPEGRFIAYSFSRPSEPDCAALIENSMK